MSNLCERFQELLDDLVESALRQNYDKTKIINSPDDDLKAFGVHRQKCSQCYTALESIGFLEYFGLPEEQTKRVIEALYPEGYNW